MTDHRCPTGYHRTPCRACRAGHADGGGCACDGCRTAESDYQAARYRGLPRPARRIGRCGYRPSPRSDGQATCGAPIDRDGRCAEHHGERLVKSWWPLPLPAVPEAPAEDWHERAACAGMDTDLFYPVKNEHVPVQAIAACSACPVRGDCLADALASSTINGDYGVWGGVSPSARMHLDHLGAPIGGRQRPDCGTEGGHRAHRRRGEEACLRCREAKRQAVSLRLGAA